MAAREFAGPVKKSTLPVKPKAKTLSSVLTEFAFVDRGAPPPSSARSGRQFAQGKTLTILTRAARDMRRLAPERTSSEARHARMSDASDQLAINDIHIALVNRKRNDVCDSRYAQDHFHHKDYALRWNKTGISNTIEANAQSEKARAYELDECEAAIKVLLAKSLKRGANIVCFGEFDYPLFKTQAREETFQHDVMNLVNGAAGPVFAVLGTYHRKEKLSGPENRVWPGHVAQNVARIALSHHLRDEGNEDSFRDILKTTPASKAGELLTGFHGIDMQVFDTIIGKLAVVICSDAYDPSIVLEFFAESGPSEYRRDIILVPSYNRSDKLTHMCQVLSLISRSIVVMVDACSERTSSSEHFSKSSVWVCGVPVIEETRGALHDKHAVCSWSGEESVPEGTIKVLKVSLPALDDFVAHMGEVDPIPIFTKVRSGTWGDPRT
jgi:hypothetical protein